MKVNDAITIVDKIDDVKQVLYSADVIEGTYIPYDIVRRILDLLHDYQNLILKMDVVSK